MRDTLRAFETLTAWAADSFAPGRERGVLSGLDRGLYEPNVVAFSRNGNLAVLNAVGLLRIPRGSGRVMAKLAEDRRGEQKGRGAHAFPGFRGGTVTHGDV